MHIIPELGPSLFLVLPFIVAFIGVRLILWGPLNQYLDDRENATEGVRQAAQDFVAQAEKRTAEIEERLAVAHAEIVELNAAARTRAQKKEAEIIAAAREEAEGKLTEAHQRIADERLAAKAELETTTKALSSDIVTTLLA